MSKSTVANNVKASVVEAISKNPNFFTAFGVVIVLTAGLSAANGKSTWWLTGLSIMAVFLVIFLFLNARVLIKATLTFITAIFVANLALQFGFYLSPYSSIGLVWMTSQFLGLTLCLAISYISIGYRSRWTGSSYALLTNLSVGALLIATLPPAVALPLALLTSLLLFLIYYKWAGALLLKSASMPENFVDERLENAFATQATLEGFQLRPLANRKGDKTFLAWNDKHAFLFYPAKLESKFSVSPRRKSVRLTHKGYSINPWLTYLLNKNVPAWRSRNAPIMLVLLDVNNTNGTRPEAIGVAIPDSGKKIPVGIYPGKGLLSSSKKSSGFFADVEKTYEAYTSTLEEKHRAALGKVGLEDSSVYLAEES